MEELTDTDFAKFITEKAEKDSWQKLFEKAKELFSDGKIYGDVLDELKKEGEDEEITKYAADTFYSVKTLEMESIVEGTTNRSEGLLWVFISTGVLILIFVIDGSIIQKILWSLVFIASLARYLIGLQQRKRQKIISQYFTPETEQNSGISE
jgi:Flp pilus assembly protein TadB